MTDFTDLVENVKVTIITAVINGRDFIGKAVQSVVDQSYPEIQYIVIDGGSDDGTLEVLQNYREKIEVLSSEPDKGISDAYNKGLSLAEGELIGTLNADDWYEKDAVVNMVKKYAASGKPEVLCGAVRFWKENIPMQISYSDINAMRNETSVHHAGVFIKRSAFEKYGNFKLDYKYAMDYELLLRFKVLGARFIPYKTLIANRRLDGISYVNNNAALSEALRAKREHVDEKFLGFKHALVVIKNYAGRLLSSKLFRPIYTLYWYRKNRNIENQSNETENN